jgi:hypothetical protein
LTGEICQFNPNHILKSVPKHRAELQLGSCIVWQTLEKFNYDLRKREKERKKETFCLTVTGLPEG